MSNCLYVHRGVYRFANEHVDIPALKALVEWSDKQADYYSPEAHPDQGDFDTRCWLSMAYWHLTSENVTFGRKYVTINPEGARSIHTVASFQAFAELLGFYIINLPPKTAYSCGFVCEDAGNPGQFEWAMVVKPNSGNRGKIDNLLQILQ